MRILWTDEALDDLAEIVAYYYAEARHRYRARRFAKLVLDEFKTMHA